MFSITFVNGGNFSCRTGQSLLDAIENASIASVMVGCRGGGCGVCKLKIVQGRYRAGRMSQAKVSEMERAEGFALACRVWRAKSDAD
jgi:ferredoxin